MGNTNRTDIKPTRRETTTGESGSRPSETDTGGAFNSSVHEIYWRDAFKREPYYTEDYTYDDYSPAYRTGYEAGGRYQGQNRKFDDVEPELRASYERAKGNSRLTWEKAKDAVRAAWHRVERVMPGDFDDDGR